MTPQQLTDLDTAISNARTNREHVPDLCRMLLAQSVVIVASWADEQATQILIQDFRLQGQSFIPFFSDESQFWSQLGHTPFVNKGVAMECKHFISLLHGDELLILNPGTPGDVQLTKGDFEPLLGRDG